MKVLILMGSPRIHGNTAELCKPFMQELEERNVEVKYITLATKNIMSCKGCYACQNIPRNTVVYKRMICMKSWMLLFGQIVSFWPLLFTPGIAPRR